MAIVQYYLDVMKLQTVVLRVLTFGERVIDFQRALERTAPRFRFVLCVELDPTSCVLQNEVHVEPVLTRPA